MASLKFDKIKKIRQKKKDIVFGYLRNCQKLFGNDDASYSQIHQSIQYN